MNIPVVEKILKANDQVAEDNREEFTRTHTCAINIMASAGAGKTSLILATAERLPAYCKAGVLEGDIAALNWRSQFNVDFLVHLLLLATWITWEVVGIGIGGTRMNGWIQARIDHILADDSWRVIASSVGEDRGSDHRPILATIRAR